MGDPLSDCSPLISAASLGKFRLVRLLVEGGAQVNRRNLRGETALLAACKALRGDPASPETVKLLTYLLQNKVSLSSKRCFPFKLRTDVLKSNFQQVFTNSSSSVY